MRGVPPLPRTTLTWDVLAILADLNIARAHLVGHDWGAALAWQVASTAPGNVDHLVTLSVGHPATIRRTLQQREKSWYMLLFQFPGIAERWLALRQNVAGPWRYESI